MSADNDPLDFTAVVLPHLDEAYNFARWLLRSTPEAQDVVQEAMLRALTYFSSFKGTNARAWLLQIVRNVAYSSLKQGGGALLIPLHEDHLDGEERTLDELIDPSDNAEMRLVKGQERRQLDALLDTLPVELRECIVLRELEEFSYKEIAEIIDTPIGTVMSRLWRARRLLMKLAVRSGP